MKWIPIEEELPEDDSDVLVAYENYDVRYVLLGRYGPLRIKREVTYVWWEDCEVLEGNVTHWMPLPEHPVDLERRKKQQAKDWEKLEDFGYIDRDDFYE